MKWNLWKRWKKHREQKKKIKEQHDLLQTWVWLERLFRSGMISFDEKQHRLFITQPIAVLLMAKGADGWTNSIHTIYQYMHWKAMQQAWEEYFSKEELEAVRNAMNGPSGDKLTRDDILRIKRSRREEIASTDMEPPKTEPFEFYIIPDSTSPSVEPFGVGYYNPETGEMEVASWSDVKEFLNSQ